MRALRVLGLADDGEDSSVSNLVCEDQVTGEQFAVPCDDRLRAAARGDLSRLGQLEIEMESQLRPKDIQARIRAGATVEQVAVLAGTSTTRIERFAYPVLQERASIAEKARKARPSIDGITAKASVEDTVAATLSSRGHDGEVTWDAFKDEHGWVLALRWNAGRSDNRAHWQFHPGPDGGTLSARDEAAAEIVDPALRILRPLRPIRQDAVTAVLLDPTVPTAAPGRAVEGTNRPATGSRSGHPAGSKLPAAQHQRFAPVPSSSATRPDSSPDQRAQRMVEETVTDDRAGVTPAQAEVARTGTDSSPRAMPHASSHPAPAANPLASAPAHQSSTANKPGAPTATPKSQGAGASTAAKVSKRGQRPAMPSWEDVLLGTRPTGQ